MQNPISIAAAICAVALAGPAWSADVVDLLSPASCDAQYERLMNCRLTPRTLVTSTTESAVPLRTVLRSVVSGICSTQYRLEAKVESFGAATVIIPYLRNAEVILRGNGGAPVNSLVLSDNSTWTSLAVLDGSCNIRLEVRWNEVDVSSTMEAQALIAAIDAEITAASNHASRMEELMLYQRAYSFMRGLADRFRVELSNQTMQELRAAALVSGPALESMILNCGDLSFEERLALLRLHGELWVLGKPEDWQRPDGTVMTMEDHLGADASEVLARLNAIIARQTENPPDYAQLYAAATAEVIRLQNKRLLALAQLDPWLP